MGLFYFKIIQLFVARYSDLEYLYLIIKTNIMKRGQKFNSTFTSRFGKVITEVITIVCINGNNVLMDNGSTYHKSQLI